MHQTERRLLSAPSAPKPFSSSALQLLSPSAPQPLRQYPAELKEQAFDPKFVQKGLIFDMVTGDLLKLREDGTIARGCHGYRSAPLWLSDAEIASKYGEQRKWPGFENLKELVRGDYFALSTGFDIPVAHAIALLVELFDRTGKAPQPGAKYGFMPDVLDALEHNYSPEAFGKRRGTFFPSIIADPDRYLHKMDGVKQWLIREAAAGKKLILVTNSDVDFAELVMQAAFGKGWRKLFICNIFAARKGRGFFELPAEETPFYTLKHDSSELEMGASLTPAGLPANERGPAAVDLEKDGCYVNGHHSLMAPLIGGDRAIYWGDHLRSDVQAVRKHTDWQAVAIVEELEEELPCHWGPFFRCVDGEGKEVGRSYFGAVAEDSSLFMLHDLNAFCS